MTGGLIADNDSGLEIDNEIAELDEGFIDPDKLNINLKVSFIAKLLNR